jgi:hypothetical protein
MMRRMSRPALLVALAAVVVIFLPGCKPKPAKLEVVPTSLTFHNAGEALILISNVSDKEGAQVEHEPCVYVTGDPLIAEVRQDGTVTANGSGATEIRVVCANLSAKVPVRVSLPAKVTIDARCDVRCTLVTTDPLALKLEGIGASARLNAVILDDQGEPVPVEPKWEVADPDFRAGTRRIGVEINKDGELRSTGQLGKYLVLVSAGTMGARGTVEVTSPVVDIVKAQGHLWVKPGGEAQIVPQGFRRSLDGNKPVGGAKYAYTSSNPEVARVNDDGKIVGGAEGVAEVVVAAESGAFAQVQVTVSAEDPLSAPPAPKRKR